jgi:NAD+ synthase
MLFDFSLDAAKEEKKIIKFIRVILESSGFSRVVLGLSGGIDSTVVCSLTLKALGAKNIHIGLFPFGQFNKEGLKDAKTLIKQLNIPSPNIHQIDIEPLVTPFIKIDKLMDNTRKGNFMARSRMMLLFDLSKKLNALVLGTENKTEKLLGYFTRFGDEASDIEPIAHLYKTQVRQLAKLLEIPDEVINKPPTAGLYEGQTDEGDFGFTYEEADAILYLYIDKKKKREEIIQSGFRKDVVEKVIKRMAENEYKHKTPYRLD